MRKSRWGWISRKREATHSLWPLYKVQNGEMDCSLWRNTSKRRVNEESSSNVQETNFSHVRETWKGIVTRFPTMDLHYSSLELKDKSFLLNLSGNWILKKLICQKKFYFCTKIFLNFCRSTTIYLLVPMNTHAHTHTKYGFRMRSFF